jgi:hypothetical protein
MAKGSCATIVLATVDLDGTFDRPCGLRDCTRTHRNADDRADGKRHRSHRDQTKGLQIINSLV